MMPTIREAIERLGADHVEAILDGRAGRDFENYSMGAWMANQLDAHAAYAVLREANPADIRLEMAVAA